MVIIGILGAIAVPRFAGANTNYRISGAAERVAASFRQASFEARSRSRTIEIRLRKADDNDLRVRTNDTLEVIDKYSLSTGAFRATIDRWRSGDGDRFFLVDAYGQFAEDGVVFITLGGRTLAIIIDAETNEVTVGTEAEGSTFHTNRGLN